MARAKRSAMDAIKRVRTPVVKRPVFTSRVNSVKVAHIEWQNPRAVCEMGERRLRILRAMLMSLPGGHRTDVEIHRNHCRLVKEHDDTFECTCVPLMFYTGASA